MSVEQKLAKTLVREFGYETAAEQTRQVLDRTMKLDSITGIELQHFWREILVQIMRERN